MQTEEWRPVPGWEGFYSVSGVGRLRSEDRTVVERTGMVKRIRGRILKLQVNRNGYLWFSLCREGVRYPVEIHTLVAKAFIGPRPTARHVVAHEDGGTQNNVVGNLRWDTRAGNMADKLRHGTHNHGEKHPNCRFSSATIAAIRASTEGSAQIAIKYGTTQDYVQKVRANKKRRNG